MSYDTRSKHNTSPGSLIWANKQSKMCSCKHAAPPSTCCHIITRSTPSCKPPLLLQGRFKRPVPAASLCMGQEFVKPGQAPAWVGDLIFNAAAKVFSNSTQVRQVGLKHSSSYGWGLN
jgi:hypothetical protein